MINFLSPWINTTSACNCACKYCYVPNNPMYMSHEVFSRLNSRIFEYLESGRINGSIYRIAGGEPLLCIDYWMHPLSEALDFSEKISCEVLTNFTRYPKQIDDLISKYGDRFNINVSLDSLIMSKPFRCGTSSSDIVMRHIKEYTAKYPYRELFLMSVITDNGDHLPALAEYVCENGFLWEINPDKNDNEFDVGKICDNLTKVFAVFKKYKRHPDTLMVGMLHGFDGNRKCANGKSMFLLREDGTIGNCQMQLNNVCTVFNDFLTELENNADNKQITSQDCLECPILSYCGGECPNLAHDLKRKKKICKLMHHCVKLLCEHTSELIGSA